MKLAHILLAMILLLLQAVNLSAVDNDIMNQIKDKVRAGDNLISTCKCSMKTEYILEDSASTRQERIKSNLENIYKDDPNKHITVLNTSTLLWSVMIDEPYYYEKLKYFTRQQNDNLVYGYKTTAYDGDRSTTYYQAPTLPSGELTQEGDITSKNRINYQASDPRHYGIYIYGKNIEKFLQGNIDNMWIMKTYHMDIGRFEYVKQENLNDYNCYVFRSTDADKNSSFEIWLAEEFLFRPVYIEILSPECKRYINIDFKIFDDGSFFPETVTFRNYLFDEKDQEYYYWTTEKRTITNIEINREISKTNFMLNIPEGVYIHYSRARQ